MTIISSGRAWRLAVSLMLLSALVAGCGNANIVNRIQVLIAVGFDRDGEQCVGTAAYPNYIQRKGSLAILKGRGKEPKMIMEQFERKSPRKVRYNKLDTIVFSHDIAKQGLGEAINTVIRDPALGSNVLLAVSSCSAESVIASLDRQEMENSPYNIVKQNVRSGGVPDSNLHLFLHDYYAEGKNPSMPSISLDETHALKIDGYALFKKDRMKLVLNPIEMTLFEVLNGKRVLGEFPFDYAGSHYSLSLHNGRMRWSVGAVRTGTFRYDVRLNGSIRNLQGNRLARDIVRSGPFAKSVELQLRDRLLALLRKIQAAGLDSLGIGECYRSVDRKWNAAAFYRDVYPALTFDVRVKANLQNSGAGE
ncbi:Ger(x)C family spore germination C-terminal domain-containing protein [Paenibacillus sp. GCM10023250]|uniref:Ger(x)C family spore germination protein n=1 Tax=Paenibacillus sp. GCM10023250 TaxID=3252648 RepID=UPI00361AE5DB